MSADHLLSRLITPLRRFSSASHYLTEQRKLSETTGIKSPVHYLVPELIISCQALYSRTTFTHMHTHTLCICMYGIVHTCSCRGFNQTVTADEWLTPGECVCVTAHRGICLWSKMYQRGAKTWKSKLEKISSFCTWSQRYFLWGFLGAMLELLFTNSTGWLSYF